MKRTITFPLYNDHNWLEEPAPDCVQYFETIDIEFELNCCPEGSRYGLDGIEIIKQTHHQTKDIVAKIKCLRHGVESELRIIQKDPYRKRGCRAV